MKKSILLKISTLALGIVMALGVGVVAVGMNDNTEARASDNTWTLVTDVNNLAVEDKVIIAASGYDYALSTTQNSNNRGQAAITKNGNNVTFGNDVQQLTLKAGTVNGTFAFYTGSGYLYAPSSSKNYLRTQETNNANGSWKIEIDSNGVATIIAQGTYTRNVMQYNQSSSLFACYSSASQKAIRLYKLVESTDPVQPEQTLTGIELDTTNVKTEFYVNDPFNYDGLIVYAIYDDNVSTKVPVTQYSVSTPDLSITGEEIIVTVTYEGFEATYNIMVSEDTRDFGTLEDPLTIDEYITLFSQLDLESDKKEVYIKGVVTGNEAYNSEHDNYDNGIYFAGSDDTKVTAFRAIITESLTTTLENYKDADTLVGATLTIKGIPSTYNGNIQLAAGCEIVAVENLPELSLESISLSQTTANLELDEVLQLTTTGVPSTIEYEVKWTSSIEEVATVDESGLVTPINSGETTITATVVDNESISASCEVTVTLPEINTAGEGSVEDNESLAIIATKGVLAEDNSFITWTGTNFTVKNTKTDKSTAIRTSDSDHFRCYQHSILTISALNDYKLSKVVFTATSSSNATVLETSIGDFATVSGTTVTATPADDVDTLEFTLSAQSRINNVEVTLVKTGGDDENLVAVKTFIDTHMNMDTIYTSDEGDGASCKENYSTVKKAFNDELSYTAREVFMTNNDQLKIVKARERLEAWAIANDDKFTDDYKIQAANRLIFAVNSDSTQVMLIVVMASISLLSFTCYFFLRKRKEQ